jgi:hypothetical protein
MFIWEGGFNMSNIVLDYYVKRVWGLGCGLSDWASRDLPSKHEAQYFPRKQNNNNKKIICDSSKKNEAFISFDFKYQLLREKSKYMIKKGLYFWLIYVPLKSNLNHTGTTWWLSSCFCLVRTWGHCSPSGLWDSPWPAATYPHRRVGPSVTGHLTGKGRERSPAPLSLGTWQVREEKGVLLD